MKELRLSFYFFNALFLTGILLLNGFLYFQPETLSIERVAIVNIIFFIFFYIVVITRIYSILEEMRKENIKKFKNF